MIICEEMKKLRAELERLFVSYTDASEEWLTFDEIHNMAVDSWICRTHFEVQGKKYSVVNGFGTLGGYKRGNLNEGLLEIMYPNGISEGYMTYKEIIQKIEVK